MSQFKTITQILNYDVANGVKNFDPVRIESDDAVTVQVFYKDLNGEDLIIRIQQSLELGASADFNNVIEPGPEGGIVEKALESVETSHTFNITGLETDFARAIIPNAGGVNIGVITKIIWRIQK